MKEENETVEECLTALGTLVEACNLPAGLLVRLLTSQLVVGCAEKTVQQELLAMVDPPPLERVIAIMRAHDSARTEKDLGNLKAAPVHNVLKKPARRGSPGNDGAQPSNGGEIVEMTGDDWTRRSS